MNSFIDHTFVEYLLCSRTRVGSLGFLDEEDVVSAFEKLRIQWAESKSTAKVQDGDT